MRNRFNITIGILFIIAGALIGSDYIISFVKENFYPKQVAQRYDSKSDAESSTVQATPQESTAQPTFIDIPTAYIYLEIVPGYYDYSNNTWTVDGAKANFATVSSVPNAKGGNTYIYGHNQSQVFARLGNLNMGDKAIVTNADGDKFEYILAEITDVNPDDLSFLNYKGKPILTLQTCWGLWDRYRRLYIFNFERKI